MADRYTIFRPGRKPAPESSLARAKVVVREHGGWVIDNRSQMEVFAVNSKIAAKRRARRRRPTRRQQHASLLNANRHLYDALLEIQGGHCALCPSEPVSRKLDLDHDHLTMTIRGLLCVRCNRQLRTWMTVEWMQRAIEYIEDPPADRLLATDLEES